MNIFILLIAFEMKHLVCDYVLQTKYMLRKTFLPLIVHSLVTSLGTLAIVLVFKPQLWWLAALDFVSHLLIDHLKASAPWKDPAKKVYWVTFGADQASHHLVHYGLIFLMVEKFL